MKLIDISLPLKPGMITYPGDPTLRFESHKKLPSVVTYLHMGSHTGTHLDAPKHSVKNGIGTDAVALTQCIGPCRVLNMTSVSQGITAKDFERHSIKRGERILVKTKNSLRGHKKFRSDFIYLEPSAAEYLARKGITLFGTDYLSVKQRGAPDNGAHTYLLKKNIVIIEGLDLSKVQQGTYFFVGLPLKLVGGDGSPIRAMLIR